MGMEKYSPTVSSAYRQDQNWFEKNGGDFGNGLDPDSLYDNDGFDAYGYDKNDFDREGINESEYLETSIKDGNYEMYLDVESDWAFDGTKPVCR